MTDTLFTDTSEFQRSAYNNNYPYKWAAFRCNDGTYRDRKFAANLAWARYAVNSGRIAGFIVYIVWRPNWQDTVATLKAMTGVPHAKMAVMLDIESWGGQIRGNQSTGINAARESIISWLGGNRKRVIGYGNAGDLANIWPTRGDAQIVLANYSSNPSTPRHLIHQFTSSGNVQPFGSPVDVNSADGLSPEQLAASLGVLSGGILMGLPTVMKDFVKQFASTDNVFGSPTNGSGHKTNPYWAFGTHVTFQSEQTITILNALHDLQSRYNTQEASLQTVLDEVAKLTDLMTMIASGQIQIQSMSIPISGELVVQTVQGGTPA